jgi:hypothetical protein
MGNTNYNQRILEQGLLDMYNGGIAATSKNKLMQARKFPKNVGGSYDLFKSYFLSGEGLTNVIKSLSDKEIALLHILHFNQWEVDVSTFEGLYKPMPKTDKRFYGRYGTFTQQYSDVLKSVQKHLVNQGLLIQYTAKTDVGSKTERQRFIFPTAFANHLPSPIVGLKTLSGAGDANDENIRIDLMATVLEKQKRNVSSIVLTQKKLQIKGKLFDLPTLNKMKLEQWGFATSATILRHQFMGKGAVLSDFLLHQLQKMPRDQWFLPTSLTPLLEAWNDPKKWEAIHNGGSSKNPYEEQQFCETGWKNNVLQQKKQGNQLFYRLADGQLNALAIEKYLSPNDKGAVVVNFNKIPLDALVVLNHLSHFESAPKPPIIASPDLTTISTIPMEIWEHPLVDWLEKNAPAFKKMFDFFHKNYGKEIVHDNLLIARITDLTLRVLVEKNLSKYYDVVVLSEEYLAFPKAALSEVEKIVTKSGNVVKRGG